jgi:ribosome-associated heat shock protein Hsp15
LQPPVRIDKWLYAVRLYKTRTLAAEACRGGHVKIGGEPVKAARTLKTSEVIVARTGDLTRTVKVLGMVDRRVGAKLVPTYMEDLTPAAEYLRQMQARAEAAPGHRPKGTGRPTKKERRDTEKIRAFIRIAFPGRSGHHPRRVCRAS